MVTRFLRFFILWLALSGALPVSVWAQLSIPAQDTNPMDEVLGQSGFAKPYEYERQAYGYDPEGVEYHENQSEDFQVIFITSAPFAAGASFLVTGMVSLATSGSFQVGGNYFLPFLGLTLAGTTTVACVSVLTNPYPPPGSTTIVDGHSGQRILAFNVPLITAKF
jgi:hypothetical protein